MKTFKNIICVAKPGEAGRLVLERAVTLAENNQAKLTLVDVIERVPAVIPILEANLSAADLQAAIGSASESGIEALLAPYRKRLRIDTKTLTGVPFLEVIRELLRSQGDLVIKLAEAPDWFNRVFGSDDMHLLRKCPCPVWLIKPGEPKSTRRILVAIDLDEGHPPAELETRQALNRQLLEMGCSLAISSFAELHIVFVWHALGESLMRGGLMRVPEEQITAYVEKVRQQYERALESLVGEISGSLGADVLGYLKPQTQLVKGFAGKEIPALVKHLDAELLVMGTVARTGVPGFIMGNTAETILNQIDCSVLAVKPPGFVTPVTH